MTSGSICCTLYIVGLNRITLKNDIDFIQQEENNLIIGCDVRLTHILNDLNNIIGSMELLRELHYTHFIPVYLIIDP
jgi:hypothetical protein